MFKSHVFEEVFFKNDYDVSWTVKILHYYKIQYAPKILYIYVSIAIGIALSILQ